MKNTLRVFWTVCLIIYLIALTKLVIFKYPDMMNEAILGTWSIDGVFRHIATANIVPFKTIFNSLFNADLGVEATTLIYNVVAFIPLGFILPLMTENARKVSKILIAGFIVSFLIELVQLTTTLGTPDVDDLILNTIGAVVGYTLFKSIVMLYQKVRGRVGTNENL